jgi:hypothetical protein
VDTLDLQAFNSTTFVFSRLLTSWADVYPLADGVFRSYMRVNVDDAIVVYEWSTDNGQITFSPTAANGTIGYAANPAVNDTIDIGTTVVTYVASSGGVVIGASLPATMANLLTFLTASVDAQISQCSYAMADNELSIVFKTTALAGNEFPIAASTSGVAVSAGTLQGAGGMITMTAPISDLTAFLGPYFYDVRWEYGATIVQLFGGTIDWLEGVTR